MLHLTTLRGVWGTKGPHDNSSFVPLSLKHNASVPSIRCNSLSFVPFSWGLMKTRRVKAVHTLTLFELLCSYSVLKIKTNQCVTSAPPCTHLAGFLQVLARFTISFFYRILESQNHSYVKWKVVGASLSTVSCR